MAISPTVLQALHERNRAASGSHLDLHIPDADSTMSMPPVTATRYGCCTQPRLQQLSIAARSSAGTSRIAACIDDCRTPPRTPQLPRPRAGATEQKIAAASDPAPWTAGSAILTGTFSLRSTKADEQQVRRHSVRTLHIELVILDDFSSIATRSRRLVDQNLVVELGSAATTNGLVDLDQPFFTNIVRASRL